VLVDASKKDTEIAQLYEQLVTICKAHSRDLTEAWNKSEGVRKELELLGIYYNWETFVNYVRMVCDE
jgi:hypothetical protein